jgi:hypothetical protein
MGGNCLAGYIANWLHRFFLQNAFHSNLVFLRPTPIVISTAMKNLDKVLAYGGLAALAILIVQGAAEDKPAWHSLWVAWLVGTFPYLISSALINPGF